MEDDAHTVQDADFRPSCKSLQMIRKIAVTEVPKRTLLVMLLRFGASSIVNGFAEAKSGPGCTYG
jgi:hypothetical protein